MNPGTVSENGGVRPMAIPMIENGAAMVGVVGVLAAENGPVSHPPFR